jgi:SAM-dependent methyltransferase/methyltransferase-like protein
VSASPHTSYDDLPYEARPHFPTHPDCLATLGTLVGLSPVSPAACRVLELGCADGGNLIPMAQALPGSHFVGIDLSPVQVEAGRRVIVDVGLTNVELHARSITDLGDDLGPFDYVVCHGVWSWVPPAVQDAILTLCKRCLTPNGLAYVSYNTYPGWHGRQLVRDMLAYHVRRDAHPAEQVRQARAYLDFLARAVAGQDTPHARLLRDEAEELRGAADTYLFHEHLEDENRPLYFHEFAARAAAAGLQYAGEAWFHSRTDDLPAEAQKTLRGYAHDLVALEQHLDFLRNRLFRRTVLCHAERPVRRNPSLATFRTLHATALARPLSESPDVLSKKPEKFRADDGATVAVDHPAVKAALVELYHAWPRAMGFDALCFHVQQRLRSADAALVRQVPQAVSAALGQFYLSHLVALHVHPPRLAALPPQRPRTTALARHQAASGRHEVCNLRHQLVEPSDMQRRLLALLDGTRDRAALVEALAAEAAAGRLAVEHDGAPVVDPERVRELLHERVEPTLRMLARQALLCG